MPDMRNGNLNVIASVAPASTIPDAYRWPLITNITGPLAIANIDVYIRLAFGQLGATPNARNLAIILGTCRAVAQSAWLIANNELIVAETVPAVCAANGAGDGLEWTVNNNAGTPELAAAHGMAILTPEELEVVKTLVWISVAVPPLQGLSLTETGHHFIPPTRRYFLSTLKQVTTSAPPEVSAWIAAMGPSFEDALFHKATHPIAVALKTGLAQAVGTKAKLIAANLGAAAVRIPAVPGDVKAAQAYLAVCNKAAPTIVAGGGSVNMASLVPLIAAVAGAVPGAARMVAVARLTAETERRAAGAAFCFGVVEEELEAAGMANHSITRAFSLKKLRDEHTTDYNLGRTLYKQVKAKRKQDADAGTIIVRNIA